MRNDIPKDSNPKHLLILDLSANGHHPAYIRRLLESDLPKISNLIIASREEMFSHPEIRPLSHLFTGHVISVSSNFALRDTDFGGANLVTRSWEIGNLYRHAYEHLSKTANIEFVIVPFIDDCLLGLGLPNEAFSGTPWLGITMRTMYHYPEMGVIAPAQRHTAIRRFLFERMLAQKSLRAILTIDPTLARFSAEQRRPKYKKIEYLPDPSAYHRDLPSKKDARTELGIPDDARVILLYGEIAARKGVIPLLEAAADPGCSDRLHVLLAGRLRSASLLDANSAYLKLSAERRIHRVDGYLDDTAERTVLAATDCMWVAYTNFYLMSGVMVLAGRHGIPVVADASGLIGYWTKAENIGVAVDVLSHSSVVAALNRLVSESEVFRDMGKRGISVFSKHDPAELQRLIIDKLIQSRAI